MTLDVILCDRDVPCERCGVFVWWDDTPHPLCDACAKSVPENCGTCSHSSEDESPLSDLYVYCTNHACFYHARLMEKSTRCADWKAAE